MTTASRSSRCCSWRSSRPPAQPPVRPGSSRARRALPRARTVGSHSNVTIHVDNSSPGGPRQLRLGVPADGAHRHRAGHAASGTCTDDVHARTITVRRDADRSTRRRQPASRPLAGARGLGRLVSTSHVASRSAGRTRRPGIAGCSRPAYSGGDGAARAVSGTCTDVAGNTSAAASVAFKYDATPPTVTPSVDRPPDGKGWYRKPVTVSFAGTDLTSGIAACTGADALRRPGPVDRPPSSGRAATRPETQPRRAQASSTTRQPRRSRRRRPRSTRVSRASAGSAPATSWKSSSSAVPGINGAKSTIVYRGNGAAFVDKTVKAGIRYRYEISVADHGGQRHDEGGDGRTAPTCHDEHGPAQPGRGRRRERAAAAPLEGGEGRHVLQRPALPERRQAAEHVARRGQAQARARPGPTPASATASSPASTSWYVWGARGTRAKPVYGSVLGSSTFTVKR